MKSTFGNLKRFAISVYGKMNEEPRGPWLLRREVAQMIENERTSDRAALIALHGVLDPHRDVKAWAIVCDALLEEVEK